MSGCPAHYTYDPLLATGGHLQQEQATVHTPLSPLIAHCPLPAFLKKKKKQNKTLLFFGAHCFSSKSKKKIIIIKVFFFFSYLETSPSKIFAVTAIHITHYPGAALSLLSVVDKCVVLA